MYIKRIIKFILHKRKPGETTNLGIRMRVTLSGERPLDFPVPYKIDLEYWNAESERVVDGAMNKAKQSSAEINRTIDEYRLFINEIFARYELLEKRVPTLDEIKELFNDMIGKTPIYQEEKVSIEKVFELYIETIGKQNSWTVSTYQKMRTVKRHFVASSKNITFSNLTTDTLQSFINYLLKKDLRNTTIAKDYQFVRWFLRWARKNGYYGGNADEMFRPRMKGIDGNQKEIIYLSLEELGKLQCCNIPLQKNYLEHVRDVFLFCCYTSLRYSDVVKLKRADVKDGYISIVTQKTTDGLKIDLNKRAQSILDKYKEYNFNHNLALPVISNQKYNEYLKELGEITGLNEQTRIVYYKGNERHDEFYPKWQLLTSHVARRTFVVTALQLGIPVEVIMRWTGHYNYEALKPYAAIVDDLKKQEMNKFDLL